jgi:hypothetical protein
MCTNLQEAGRRKWMSKEAETNIRADTCIYMHIWTVSIQILFSVYDTYMSVSNRYSDVLSIYLHVFW